MKVLSLSESKTEQGKGQSLLNAAECFGDQMLFPCRQRDALRPAGRDIRHDQRVDEAATRDSTAVTNEV